MLENSNETNHHDSPEVKRQILEWILAFLPEKWLKQSMDYQIYCLRTVCESTIQLIS